MPFCGAKFTEIAELAVGSEFSDLLVMIYSKISVPFAARSLKIVILSGAKDLFAYLLKQPKTGPSPRSG
jgi:hypothetical protein